MRYERAGWAIKLQDFAPVPIEAVCRGVSWDGPTPAQRALSQALYVSGLDFNLKVIRACDIKEMVGGRGIIG